MTELDDVRTDNGEQVESREIRVGKSGKRQEAGCHQWSSEGQANWLACPEQVSNGPHGW